MASELNFLEVVDKWMVIPVMVYIPWIKKNIRTVLKPIQTLKIFRESLVTLLFCLGGLIAGSILVTFLALVLIRPWIIIMYPLVLSTRGAINGVFCGKLGTGLQTRLIEPNFKKNTTYYYAIIAAIFTLSLISSLFASVITFLFSYFSYQITYYEFDKIFSTFIITKVLSVIITIPFASTLGFFTYKRGFDPDVFLYPISATIADIWTTISFILSLALIFWSGTYFALIHFFVISFIILIIFIAIVLRRHKEYWKTLKESFIMLLIVIPISAVSGVILSRISHYIRKSPGILAVYPSLTNTLGAAAAIFGSISTTKLALGFIQTKISEIKGEISDLLQIGSSVLIVYLLYSIISSVIDGDYTPFVIIMLSFLILFPIVTGITFTIGIFTFTRSLDPDNFIIPFETTLTDFLLTLVLSLLIFIFYF
ncbi:MAG: magnesium transporter [Candidatus Thorarchaeota archaeon]